MASIVGLLWALSLVAILGAGLGNLIGVRGLRDWFVQAAVLTVVLAMLLPLVGHGFRTLLNMVGGAWVIGTGWLHSLAAPAFVVGNLALAVWVWRRRRSAGGSRSGAEEIARVRGRRRTRISLPHDDEEES